VAHVSIASPSNLSTAFAELADLSPFITGYEPLPLCAISLTAAQKSQCTGINFKFNWLNEEWVQWPQIEIQQTTGANVE
jgi:hypothetical protein